MHKFAHTLAYMEPTGELRSPHSRVACPRCWSRKDDRCSPVATPLLALTVSILAGHPSTGSVHLLARIHCAYEPLFRCAALPSHPPVAFAKLSALGGHKHKCDKLISQKQKINGIRKCSFVTCGATLLLCACFITQHCPVTWSRRMLAGKIVLLCGSGRDVQQEQALGCGAR